MNIFDQNEADALAQDMHYAEFAEDEVGVRLASRTFSARPMLTGEKSAALLAAIKEYEASKWKVIGAKLGKPAKVRFVERKKQQELFS